MDVDMMTNETQQLVREPAKVYRMDGLFPKIDNLEYFPTKLLQKIFGMLGIIDLEHLAATSLRFESIARDFINSRQYQIKNESTEEQEKFRAIMNHSGNCITSVEVWNMRTNCIYEYNWMIYLLNLHADRIEKLIFNDCKFQRIEDTLSKYTNIEHLAFRNCQGFADMKFPAFRKLRRFECVNSFDFNTFEYEIMIKNNPQLESLIIEHDSCKIKDAEIFECVTTNSTRIKELQLLNTKCFLALHMPMQLSPPMQQIKSLGFATNSYSYEFDSYTFNKYSQSQKLLQLFGSQCQQIETLKLLHLTSDLKIELIQPIQHFEQLKTLSLYMPRLQDKQLAMLAQLLILPNLLKLCLRMTSPIRLTSKNCLTILEKCPNLREMVIDIDEPRFNHQYYKAEFFVQFLGMMQNRDENVAIEIKERGKNMIIITKDGIVRLGMLTHWANVLNNRSNFDLLGLAQPQEMLFEERKPPFQKIFNYLNENDTLALYHSSSKCRGLVQKFMENRYQEQKEQFHIKEGDVNARGLIRSFGCFITHIQIDINQKKSFLWTCINQDFLPNLVSMELNNSYKRADEYGINAIVNTGFNFSRLKHFKYSSTNYVQFDISKLSNCHELETLEIDADICFINIRQCSGLRRLNRVKLKRTQSSVREFLWSLNSMVTITFELGDDADRHYKFYSYMFKD